MKINYNFTDKFDFQVFFSALALVMFGLIAIYSATYNHPTAGGNFQRQLIFSLISLAVFFVVYFLPSQIIRILTIPSYFIMLFFLFLVVFMGRTVYGAQSWLIFGPVGFQPSEFTKISTVLMMAYWLDRERGEINSIKQIGVALAIGFLPVIFILMEPDLGTAIVFMVTTLVMVFWSGINLFGLFVVLSPTVVIFSSLFGVIPLVISLLFVLIALFYFKRNLFLSASVFVTNLASGVLFDFFLRVLKPHQQKRIATFIDPSSDPLGYGYNALQAKVAIGSGGFWGKGFLQGNQTQLRFIPEQWTDFIFCVIGEEFGLIGSILIIAFFLIILIKFIKIASSAKNRFTSLIVIGLTTILFVHFAINVGMNIGITPVIGLPLPFVSYGGSSLLANFISIGIVLNIYRNRKLRL